MKISLITVTYNSAATIANCLASVHEQTYRDLEHIIVDGASTDGTVNIIKSVPNRVSQLVSEPDHGIYDAMNKGIGLATGEVVGMLNSDDQLYGPTVLEQIVQAFKSHPVDCTYGNLIYSDGKGKVVRTWQSKPFEHGLFAKSWTPAHPTFYCKRELYLRYGLYKTDYRIAADVELMLRFLEVHGARPHFIDHTLVNMLAGGVSNQGIGSTITITRELQRAFRENNLPFNLLKYLFFKGLKLREYRRKPPPAPPKEGS
jgi:glycosyltransferase involved in cell wall biosynthesis